MFSLNQLSKPAGSWHRKKRVGRGQGSGWGKTAGRGGKGQKARTGNMHFEGFEGGQMPLQRRMPKFGFQNPFRREFTPINIGDLEACFPAGSTVDAESLFEYGILRNIDEDLKLLGAGELTKKLTVRVHRASASAKTAVEKAGGSIELIADKVLTVPKRGEGVDARIAKERAAKRAKVQK